MIPYWNCHVFDRDWNFQGDQENFLQPFAVRLQSGCPRQIRTPWNNALHLCRTQFKCAIVFSYGTQPHGYIYIYNYPPRSYNIYIYIFGRNSGHQRWAALLQKRRFNPVDGEAPVKLQESCKIRVTPRKTSAGRCWRYSNPPKETGRREKLGNYSY
jgi:hypothetical protein